MNPTKITLLLFIILVGIGCKNESTPPNLSNDSSKDSTVTVNQVEDKPIPTIQTDSIVELTGWLVSASLNKEWQEQTGIKANYQLITPEGQHYFISVKNGHDVMDRRYCIQVTAKFVPLPKDRNWRPLIEVLSIKGLYDDCASIEEFGKKPPTYFTEKEVLQLNQEQAKIGERPYITIATFMKKAKRPADDIAYDYQLIDWSQNLVTESFTDEDFKEEVYMSSNIRSHFWRQFADRKRPIKLVGRLVRGYSENFVFEIKGILKDEILPKTNLFETLLLDKPTDYVVKINEVSWDAFNTIVPPQDQLARKICKTQTYWDDNVYKQPRCKDLIDRYFLEQLPQGSRDTSGEILTIQYAQKAEQFKDYNPESDKGSAYRIVDYSEKTNHLFLRLPNYEDTSLEQLINLETGERPQGMKGYLYPNADMTKIIVEHINEFRPLKDPTLSYWEFEKGKYQRQWVHHLIGEARLTGFRWNDKDELYALATMDPPVRITMRKPLSKQRVLKLHNQRIIVNQWEQKQASFPIFVQQTYIDILDSEVTRHGFFIIAGADSIGIWSLQGIECSSATTIATCAKVQLVYSRYESPDTAYDLPLRIRDSLDLGEQLRQQLESLATAGTVDFSNLKPCKFFTYDADLLEISSRHYDNGKTFQFELKQDTTFENKPGCWKSMYWRNRNR